MQSNVKLRQWLFLLPTLVLLGLLFLLPLGYGLKISLSSDAGYTLGNYLNLFSDHREVSTIYNTFKISLPVTTVSTLIAIAFAYFFRGGIVFERFFSTVLILPMTLGTVLISLGMLNVLGKNGWLNLFLQSDLKLTYNTLSVCIALFVLHFPLTYLLIAAHFSALDKNLENAAMLLGANRVQTFFKVLLPLTAPAIFTAMALNFVGAFNVFPNAVLLGQPMGETRVLTISAYEAAFEYFDFPKGSAIAILMGILQLSVVVAIFYLKRKLQPKSISVKG